MKSTQASETAIAELRAWHLAHSQPAPANPHRRAKRYRYEGAAIVEGTKNWGSQRKVAAQERHKIWHERKAAHRDALLRPGRKRAREKLKAIARAAARRADR